MTRRILAILSLTLLVLSASADVQKLTRSEQKERIKNLADKYRQFVLDVEPIMQPEELDTFLQLESDPQRDLYIDDFWQRRARAHNISVDALRTQYYERLQTAKDKYRSIASDRARIYVIQGEPLEVKNYGGLTGCRLVQPLEVWTYGYLPDIGRNVQLIFYQPRGSADYRLWQGVAGANRNETLQDIIASEVMATVHDNESAAVQYVFGLSTEPACRRAQMTQIECECADGAELRKLIELAPITQPLWVNAFKPPPVNPEDVRRLLQSVVISNPSAPKLPADFSVAYPSRRGERTDVQMAISIPRSKLVMKDVAGGKMYSVDVTGEVMKEDRLYEQYRYRFDYPIATAPDPIVAVVDRFLRPGEYTSRIKITDINSNSEAVIENPITVPEVKAPAGATTAAGSEGDPFNALRIIPLPDALLSGRQHIETIVAGDIKSVDFYLDGTKVVTKRSPPFAIDLDLGDVPTMHRVRAVGLDAHNEFVAGDDFVINSGGGDFRVRIVSPRIGRKLAGATPVQLAVTTPGAKKLEKVELYVNDARVATLFGPPYEQTVQLPADARLSYLRAVATLADPDEPPVEDTVVLNTPDFMTEVNVHLVELPTTVTRHNKPVNDLPQSAFTVLDEGKPAKVVKFEHVSNLNLSIGIAIDTSTSMYPRSAEAQKAGGEFLNSVMRQGDKGFLVAFDLRPDMVQRWTSNAAELKTGLAKLRTQESTALYDAIVYSLYNFSGTRGQKALVVITDGNDTSSKFSFDQALEYAKRAGVPIYGIGIGIDKSEIDTRYKFGKFCSETGGNVYYINEVTDLHRIYDEIQNELRSQYILSFYPPEDVKPGSKWRNVTVQVTTGNAKTIRGYYP